MSQSCGDGSLPVLPPNSEPSGPSSVPSCLYCGEWDFRPNVECWEQYDVLICDDCADQCHDDNSQFGVGA